MNYLSVCSGIEAATVAWHPLGWKAIGFSEIEKFPSQVLAHHYPDVPNLGDMTKFKEWNLESNVDVFVGGTPCQSFSVAGLRKGLDDPRGNLMLTYLAIANQYRPKWLVWENVPGVLSSNSGRDFATFLGGLGELGYGFAYRVLDAQYFGVAQRRRRVFVVGYLGDWRRAAAVLFERHSLSGNIAPRREKRESSAQSTRAGIADVSPTIGCELSKQVNNQMIGNAEAFFIPELVDSQITYDMSQHHNPQTSNTTQITTKNCSGIRGDTPLVQSVYGIPGNWIGRKPENGGNAVEPMYDLAPCLTKTDQHGVAQPIGTDLYNGAITGDVAATMSTHGGDGSGIGPTIMQHIDCIGGLHPNAAIAENQSPTLTNAMGAGGGHIPVVNHMAVCSMQPIGFEANMSLQQPSTGNVFQTLTRNTHASVNINMAVRRLLPVECERLQGFPDNYTDITPKGKPTPDGPRYKALGNSMAVPVMAWIGKRIQEVENIK